MEKNMLNEITRIRKIMAINENYDIDSSHRDTYNDTSYEDNFEKGGGPDEEEIPTGTMEIINSIPTVIDPNGDDHTNFLIYNTKEELKKEHPDNLNWFQVNVDGIEKYVLIPPSYSERPEMY